jgi:TRAP-type C4-dicarboxylate transport system substrate-binding protein
VPAGTPRFANTIFAFAMNQAKYDSLPPELKKVIDANSGLEASAAAGEKAFDAVVDKHRKLASDRGNTFATLSPAEVQRWAKASEPVEADWIKEADSKGANGAKLLEEARALIKQYQH